MVLLQLSTSWLMTFSIQKVSNIASNLQGNPVRFAREPWFSHFLPQAIHTQKPVAPSSFKERFLAEKQAIKLRHIKQVCGMAKENHSLNTAVPWSNDPWVNCNISLTSKYKYQTTSNSQVIPIFVIVKINLWGITGSQWESRTYF